MTTEPEATTDHGTAPDQERGAELLAAAGRLRDEHAGGGPVSTSRLLNPLLDLWAMAADLGPDVTGPIEELLTVYNGPRDLATPDELSEFVERLSSALQGAMV